MRTAVEPGSSTDSDFGAALVPYSSAFAATLQGLNAFDTIWALNGFQRTPLKTRIAAVAIGATGDSPGEGTAKVISRFTLSQGTLEPTKSSVIVILTDEVVRTAGEAGFVWLSDQLRKALPKPPTSNSSIP